MSEIAIDWSSLATKLRTARMQHGFSLNELAKRSGVNRCTLLRMEHGKPCYFSTIEKVASALFLTADALAHPASFPSGLYYAQEKEKELIRCRPTSKASRRLPTYSQDRLKSFAERARIGGLGLVSCFEWVPDISLPGGKLRATLLELHGETAAAAHDGEELVHAIRGGSKVKIGSETILLQEGETATFWPDVIHSYLPAKPLAPGELPPLLFSVRLDGPYRHGQRPSRQKHGTPTRRAF